MAAGLLDKFFIQYLTNAKQAAADTRDFAKANDELADGTKKLTDEERKRNKEIEATARALTDVVAGVTAAAAAYVGLAAVKNGVVKAADFNNSLYLQNKLLGQSSQEVAAFGSMLQKFGGTSEGFNSWLSSTTMEFNTLGIKLPEVGAMLRTVNQQLQGMSQTEKNFQLARYGITDPAMILMLSQTTQEFEKQYAAKVKLNEISEESQRVANDFGSAYGDLKNALNSVFTQIETQLLPVLTPLVKTVADLIANHKGWTEGIIAVGTALTTLAGILVSRGLLVALGVLASEVLAITWPMLAFAGAIAAVVAAYKLLSGTDKDVGAGANGSSGSGKMTKKNFGAAQASMAFFKSNGYTQEQAAGWTANMLAESGGDPGARGDGGAASGLFQWHGDRAAKILAGTGIDVRTAGFDDQLKAAAWEAEQRGDAARIRKQLSADAAASAVTTGFERPANADYQAIMRGKSAIDIANNSPLSSGGVSQTNSSSRSVNMSVGGVHVSGSGSPEQTAQSVHDMLSGQFRDTISNFDDAVEK